MRKFITIIALLAIGLTVWGEELTLEGTLKGNIGRWFNLVKADGTVVTLAPESDGKVLGFDYAAKGIAIGDQVSVTGDFRIKADGTTGQAQSITNMEKK